MKNQSSIEAFDAARKECSTLFIIILVLSIILMFFEVISANAGVILIAIGFLIYVLGDGFKAVAKLLSEKDGEV